MISERDVERMRQLMLDNRVLKKYTEDLKEEVAALKLRVIHLERELKSAVESRYIHQEHGETTIKFRH